MLSACGLGGPQHRVHRDRRQVAEVLRARSAAIQIHLVFTQPVDPANVTVIVGYGPVAKRPVARRA
jgi:hypothetical protein